MADSDSSQETETSSNVVNTDRRVGVEGDGARIQGEGAQAWENSGIAGGTAPISTYSDTGDIFAPVFQFGNTPNFSQYAQQPDVSAFIAQTRASGYYGPEFTDAQIAEDYWNNVGKQQQAASSEGGGQFGGAVQGSGQNVGGSISAPIASGEDSQAQQSGVVAVGGDSENLVAVTAPVSGPLTNINGDNSAPIVNAAGGGSAPITAGGDQEFSAPVITNNSGSVNITTADPDVLKKALDANSEALTAAISSNATTFDKTLSAISQANQDPEERISGNALGAVVVVALGFAAFAYFGRRAA